MKIDLIIPTYMPDKSLIDSIAIMQSQTVKINKIIIMNTEQKYFERMTYATSFVNSNKNMEVKHISKKEFDHGRTRNQGVARSDADYFLFMTQDAVPVGNRLVEELVYALEADDSIAVAYARQIAKEGSSEREKYTRLFNYPEESSVHSAADIATLGIKAYFCSNVCAMYRRKTFDELGGFLNHAIFNEDMLYAAKAINEGYKVAYVSTAKVLHSHNYTNAEQYSRNFDIGVSHAKHPEIFEGLNTKGEGMRLVKKTAKHLSDTGNKFEIPKLYIQSAYKYLGYRSGKRFMHLSKKAILRKTMNPSYWREDELIRDRGNINARLGYGRSEEELAMITKVPITTSSSSYKETKEQ
ncbi:MAG: glycosyltransferase family 2 protein [Lachnospiraceae bacterium]|nr:glycosyltransferase family 2 protein [Lachnospiraceae bacterium]